MESLIEKTESHWALRYVGDMRGEMRELQTQIGKAAEKLMMTLGMERLLPVVRIVPQGTVHKYEYRWSLTFCANTKKEAQGIQATIRVLLNARRFNATQSYTYLELTS